MTEIRKVVDSDLNFVERLLKGELLETRNLQF